MNILKRETGKKHGRWTVIDGPYFDRESNNNAAYWKCRCDCGTIGYVRGDNLRRGASTKCARCAKRGRRQKVRKW